MQDKHRPCQDGLFSDTASQRKIMSTLSRAQRWMRHEGTSVQQYAGNYTESCHNKTKMCDLVTRREFSCLQESSKLSRSVLNGLSEQNKAFTW